VRSPLRRFVSIIVPTLNENVSEALPKLDAHLRAIEGWEFEILVVDDSPDDRRATVKAEVEARPLVGRVTVRFIEGSRTGKGAAVRLGVERAAGSVVFVVDCDLPVPLGYFTVFLRLIEEGHADVVIAERPSARNYGRPMRAFLSYGLLAMQRVITFHSSRFSDTQCGFKAFRADVLREIAARQIIEGGMFDVEYLYAATKRRAKVVTVTVVPNPEVRESRVNVWRCLRRDPIDMLRIKVRGVTHGYD